MSATEEYFKFRSLTKNLEYSVKKKIQASEEWQKEHSIKMQAMLKEKARKIKHAC